MSKATAPNKLSNAPESMKMRRACWFMSFTKHEQAADGFVVEVAADRICENGRD